METRARRISTHSVWRKLLLCGPARCKSTGAGLIKQAEHISAAPPLNGFHAPEVTAAVCRHISHSHVACFLTMFFRNHSPLMSFGASFVSFLVSNAVCLYFPFMVQVLTQMTLKHLFQKVLPYHAEVRGFPRRAQNLSSYFLWCRSDRLAGCHHDLGVVFSGIFIILVSPIMKLIKGGVKSFQVTQFPVDPLCTQTL